MAKDADRQFEHEDADERVEEAAADAASPEQPTCPQCGWHNTRLSHTRTVLDSLLRALSLHAYRCRTCGNRFRVVRHAPKG
jgi:DNA-directed RNA polymerase subunit M/transcription elongation factor TFIIS